MSAWTEAEAARIQREGETITDEEVARIADRFRRQVGDSYTLIADRIEADHAGRSTMRP